MDARRLAACAAVGLALSTFTQRRRVAALLASIGRRLVQGDGMRALAVRMIDRLMANAAEDEDAFHQEILGGVNELLGALQRVAADVQRQRYFEVCGPPAVETDAPPASPAAASPLPAPPPAPAFLFTPDRKSVV